MSDTSLADGDKKTGPDKTATPDKTQGDKGGDKGSQQQQQRQQQQQPDKGAKKTSAAGDGVDDIDIGPDDEDKPGYWPKDWRAQLAGKDEKTLKQLERFTSPEALWKKLVNQEKVIRSRAEKPEKPGDDATDEEKVAWRKANNVPEEPVGYIENLELTGDKELGEDDLPVAAAFAEIAHDLGAPQEWVNRVVDGILEFTENEEADRAMADDRFKKESRDALRDEWGVDFKRNITAITPLFVDHQEEFEQLLAGRTRDGRIIGDDPRMIKFLSGLALQMYPEASVTEDGVPMQAKAIDDEIASLTKMSAKQDSEYWRGPNAKTHQNRLAELLTAKGKIDAKKKK